MVLALAALALALPAAALADRTPPADQQVDQAQIGMQCSTMGLLFAFSEHQCQGVDDYRNWCFEGLAFGVSLDEFVLAESFGHLNVDDDQIFRNTSSFQFNYALAFTNLNFFANVTHRLGHYHGGGFPGGLIGIGGGLGEWKDLSDEPGGGNCRHFRPFAAQSAPVTAQRQSRSPSSGSVRAGHRSPAKAVASFVKGFNRENPGKACSYVKPSLQTECRSALESLGPIKVRLRHIKVLSSRENGNRAKLKVRGAGCLGSRCRRLKNASGRPKVTVRSNRVDRKWYLR
jgi:hypothetical protein